MKSVLRAAWTMDATMEWRVEKARRLAGAGISPAAGSALEGLEERSTIKGLDVPPSLHRCLVTINTIETPQSGVRMRTRRVCRWRDGGVVKRLDNVGFPGYGKELAEDDRLPGFLGLRSDPQRVQVCHLTGGGVVTGNRRDRRSTKRGAPRTE